MRSSSIVGLVGSALLFSAGCGDDTASGGSGGSGPSGGGGSGAGSAAGPRIDLVVDADRNGVAELESEADQAGEEEASFEAGAIFLPNLDDDDGDGYRDSDDPIVAAGADELDMAIFKIAPCDECPKGSKGTLTIDELSTPNVRVFAYDEKNSAWVLVAGETHWCQEDEPTCTPTPTWELNGATVKAGITLAIEGRDVVREEDGWNGVVELTYAVVDGNGKAVTSASNETGTDVARLRMAPWILNGNTSPFDTVWSSADSSEFVDGVGEGAEMADVSYDPYSNYGDQWTQDFFQTGYFAMPRAGENGEVVVQGMAVANARPWGRSNSDSQLPIRWLKKNYLGPDRAILQVYKTNHTGDSYDSHGNHDLIPPYENGDAKFPNGRIIIGSGILPETREFYRAQLVQAPYWTFDTSWLAVGHVDESLSYVPANTPRGWKLLVGSQRLALEMLEEAQADGFGSAVLFEGKEWYGDNGFYAADITVDELLADEDILSASSYAQGVVDDEVEKLQADLGLADDEIVEIPFMIENLGGGYHVAYQPGTVNMLVMGDVAVIPKPFGPVINGVDIFEAQLEEALGTGANDIGSDGNGMQIVFADNWDLYHRLLGEVHCGTNPEPSVAPFSSVNWWESSK